MMTKSNNTAAGQSVAPEPDNLQTALPPAIKEPSRRRRVWGLGTAALAAAIALSVFGVGRVRGQAVPALQIIPLGQGSSNSQNPVTLRTDGATDVLQTEIIFQPGAQTGWHYHPGPVVVVVKTGSLTMIHSNGCMTVYGPNSSFFELKDVIHNVINQTGGVVDVYATFISPAGTQPLIPAANPGGVCRSGDDGHEGHEGH